MPIELKDVTIETLPILSEKLACLQNGDCNLSIFSLIGRAQAYEVKYALVDDKLVLHWRPYHESSACWVLPHECCQTAINVLEEVENYCKARKLPVVLFGRFTELTKRIESWMPYRNFLTISSNSWWDYLYDKETFIKLEGRKLHGKRNFVKRFRTAYPDAKFLPINKGTIPLCRDFLKKWYEDYGELNEGLRSEAEAINLCFEYWDEFKVHGGLLRIGDQTAGFSFGSKVADDIFAVHIEKADRNITGAYPALACELAASLPEEIKYLNREEDLGEPGLRKAKQDWYPSGVVRKTYLKLEKESEFGSNSKPRDPKKD